MNSKWVEAQVTVFAALIYSVVVSLIIATVNSAAFSVGFLNADLVTYAGVNSEFSQYFRPLADNFNIFGLEKIESMDKEIENFMHRSLETDSSLMPVKLSGVTIKNSMRLTDNCGLPIKDQVVKYMKYGAVSDVVNLLLGNEEYRKKCEVVQDLNDKLNSVTDIISEMDKNLVMATSKLDGLMVKDGTFAVENDFPVYSGDTFLKMGVFYSDSQKLGITDGRVYEAIHNKCQSMLVRLELINDATNGSYEKKLECNLLINLAYDCRLAGITVINCCNKYLSNKNKLNNSIKAFEDELNNSKSTIGQEIYDGFNEEILELKKFGNGQNKSLFDVEKMIAAVNRNNQKLQVIEDLTKGIRDNSKKTDLAIDEIKELLADYDFSDMVVDYSDVKFVNESGVFSIFKNLKGNIGKSLMSIITNGLEVSSESVDMSNLAMNKYSRDKDIVAANNTCFMEKALFVDYLRTNFDCFTNMDFEDSGLKYDLEFIYAGGDSDKENLSDTLKALVNFREGSNFICIMTDSSKKKEAYTLAAGLLGFTGSTAIVKIGQYLIMAAWAYAESIMDVKRLVNGDKLELFKTKTDWKMNLQRVLTLDFSSDNSKKNTGLDYRIYLLLLMMLSKEARMYYATMTAMEMRMIAMGFEEFRMENFLYEINGTVEFLIRDQVYEKDFGYRY